MIFGLQCVTKYGGGTFVTCFQKVSELLIKQDSASIPRHSKQLSSKLVTVIVYNHGICTVVTIRTHSNWKILCIFEQKRHSCKEIAKHFSQSRR